MARRDPGDLGGAGGGRVTDDPGAIRRGALVVDRHPFAVDLGAAEERDALVPGTGMEPGHPLRQLRIDGGGRPFRTGAVEWRPQVRTVRYCQPPQVLTLVVSLELRTYSERTRNLWLTAFERLSREDTALLEPSVKQAEVLSVCQAPL